VEKQGEGTRKTRKEGKGVLSSKLTARASSESSMSSRKVMGFEGAVGRGPEVPMSMMVAFCKAERSEEEGRRRRRR